MTSTDAQPHSVARKPASRLAPVAVLTKRQRSALANGDTLITGVDGRSAEARRFRDLCLSFAEPLGGFTGLAEHDAALVRHAASLTMESERMQRQSVRGEPVDAEQLVRVTNALTRTLNALSARRKPAEQANTVEQYRQRKAAERAAREAAHARDAPAAGAAPPDSETAPAAFCDSQGRD